MQFPPFLRSVCVLHRFLSLGFQNSYVLVYKLDKYICTQKLASLYGYQYITTGRLDENPLFISLKVLTRSMLQFYKTVEVSTGATT
jgi:hypothetical protein